LERLVRLKTEGKIKDFVIEIPTEAKGIDPVTGAKIYPVRCITIEKNNGGKHQISGEQFSNRK